MITKIPFPLIDYDKHPAFAGLVPESTMEKSITVAVNEIEKKANDYFKSKGHSEQVQSKKALEQSMSVLKDLVIQDKQITTLLKEAITEGIDNAMKSLLAEGKYHRTRKEYKSLSQSENMLLERLRKDGAFSIFLKPEEIQELNTLLADDINELKNNRENVLVRRLKKVKSPSKAFSRIKSLLTDLGLLNVSNAYHGHSMELSSASLEVSRPESTWWKSCYQDVQMPTSKSAYMHYDFEFNLQKFVIYLDEVNEKNGPFSVIMGSNNIELPKFVFTFVKELELVLRNKNVFEKSKVYYRNQFFSEANRKLFLQIPKALRGASHFGDDLIDGSEIQKELLGNEKIYTSKDGNLIMFDGHHGMHRGGLCKEKERLALFLTLTPQMSFFTKAKLSAGYKIKTLLSKLGNS